MENITDIFFDLDHTLWDFDTNSALAFDKVFKDYFPTLNSKTFFEVFAPINQQLWKLYQVDKITRDELRYRRLRQTADILKIEVSDDEIALISSKYIEYLPQNNFLFDGAIAVLDYLSSKYKLHIITNGLAPVQEMKIDNSGLRNYFKTVTNSEMVGVKKPHITIFEHALKLANVHKECAVMIGDCIDADVRGAIDFGMRAILFDEKGIYTDEEVIRIKHLLELKNIL